MRGAGPAGPRWAFGWEGGHNQNLAGNAEGKHRRFVACAIPFPARTKRSTFRRCPPSIRAAGRERPKSTPATPKANRSDARSPPQDQRPQHPRNLPPLPYPHNPPRLLAPPPRQAGRILPPRLTAPPSKVNSEVAPPEAHVPDTVVSASCGEDRRHHVRLRTPRSWLTASHSAVHCARNAKQHRRHGVDERTTFPVLGPGRMGGSRRADH